MPGNTLVHKKKIRVHLMMFVIFVIQLDTVTAQKTQAIITFENGKTMKGFGKLAVKSSTGLIFLKFRKTKKDNPIKFIFSDFKNVQIYDNHKITSYLYVNVKDENEPKVLEEVAAGNVSLYKHVYQKQNPGFSGASFGSMGSGFSIGTNYIISNYYVKKGNEPVAFHLGSNQSFSKNFKKEAADYFSDCPELVARIESKEFKILDLAEIIKFYNEHCN